MKVAKTKKGKYPDLKKPGIPPELYHKVRVIAALEDRSITSVFQEAVEEWMANPKRRYNALFLDEDKEGGDND